MDSRLLSLTPKLQSSPFNNNNPLFLLPLSPLFSSCSSYYTPPPPSRKTQYSNSNPNHTNSKKVNFFTNQSPFNNPFSSSSSSSSSSTTCCSHSQKPHHSNHNNQTNKNNIPICFSVPKTLKNLTFLQTTKWVSTFIAYNDSERSKKESCYLQNGGLGVALLSSITTNAKVRISPFVATLATNPTFVSGLVAWVIAQSTKVLLNFFVERKWNLRLLCASGGMPSSHSALCTALTTAVALCHGVADSLFPVCLGFSLIVMYDAIGVRRHAGMQAEVLNMIVADLFKGHPISERKLKELLGHTPSQVVGGALLGFLVSCFCCQACVVRA
ncbi:hypothetical protein RIF29_24081 [Crotalaria pallida]|uniref:Acid phosphatase/vanadium-dependent haloperoxidase-related protein n=1 Tax=Crotalaria pallida TaxID=3830 RepID=A0AAN9HY45_CROPI